MSRIFTELYTPRRSSQDPRVYSLHLGGGKSIVDRGRTQNLQRFFFIYIFLSFIIFNNLAQGVSLRRGKRDNRYGIEYITSKPFFRL